jgi:CO/xanthine dehydrogenase Mo-binding subunit
MTTTQQKQYKVVGTRPIRHDGYEKVTGIAKYGADFQAPGLLYGKVLRSPHAHARIKSIDVSKALALPGVKAVVTAKDLPQTPASGSVSAGEGGMSSVRHSREQAFASEKVLYKGHPIAAVAATNAHIAEEALDLIKVEYQVLPHILTAPAAMKEGAPIILEDLTPTLPAGETKRLPNVAAHLRMAVGDVEKGFKEADIVVEREFTTATVHQGYIEPHPSSARWDPDGNLTVWTSTQGPFWARRGIAQILDIPESRVKVVPMEIGGGFGGKIPTYMEIPAALLARKTGHPVKLVMTRAEVLQASGPTSGSYMKVKLGATKDGKLTAAQAYLAFEAGAFPGSPVGGAMRCMLTMYKIPNTLVDGYDVIVNKPKTAAYRAPGAPIGSFAVEQIVDELAEKLKMDPIEFRLKNAVKTGDRPPTGGPAFNVIGYVETLQAIKSSEHWKTPLTGKFRGRGVASGFWGNAGLESSCTINVNSDGTISMITGSVDIGGTRPSTAMQAAEVLGIRAEDVRPSVGDTASVGFTSVTGGSRTAVATGYAAYEAAQKVLQEMKQRAALLWETKVDDVQAEDGVFSRKSNPSLKLTFKELSAKLMTTGGPVTASASVVPSGVGASFATHVVDVAVDPETGKVDILRYTTATDVGKAIHPSYVEGQIQGGVAQGIGWALNEEYVFDDKGGMVNTSLLDYRMPTALDLPMLETILVEVPYPGHPYGARGVGEIPIVPPQAAVANAIAHALGVRMTSMPMSPGKVWEAYAKAQSVKK